ncbi:MAG: zinc-binding dehydrogenase, partial [Bacteroidetes bacterium]|nr:zinc-binding dehydrogenase [Bacteroidota bacterium]
MNPNLLGHEGSGIVEKVGEGITKVKEGDHVIISWIKGYGANVLPKPYFYNVQKINVGYVTTFNEYSLASENRVTKIPKNMPLKEAALIGCAVSTGASAVFNNAKVKEGKSVMVIGVGGIGINMVHAASISKANPIIAVDINDEKLEFSKKFGATHTINSTKIDIREGI